MGIKSSQNCSSCTQVKITITHLYWHCPERGTLWNYIRDLISKAHRLKIELEMGRALFGIWEEVDNLPKVTPLLCTMTRYYIYCS